MTIKVSHPQLGLGELIKILPRSGLEEIWLVSFANGALEIGVPISDLSIVNGKKIKTEDVDIKDPTPKLHKKTTKKLPKAIKRERFAIEALRYGLVYTDTVSDQTVGLEGLIRKVEEYLEKISNTGQADFITIVGPWGSGKTHSLKLCSYLARNYGFATSFVETSSNHNLARPAQLHDQIVKNLVPHNVGIVTGPSVFVEKYCRSQQFREALRGLQHLGPAFELAYTARNKDTNLTDAVINFFSGEYTMTKLRSVSKKERLDYHGKSLHSRLVKERPARFRVLLHEWARVAKLYNQAGRGGLVILIDEAELLVDIERSSESRIRAMNALVEVIKITKFKLCPLLFIFATTTLDIPHDPLRYFVKMYNIYVHTLDKPSSEMAIKVAKRLICLYENAYADDNININKSDIINHVEKKIFHEDVNLRSIIRSLIDHLDISSVQ
jgi:bacteriophage exclusion system BrxC/D-like protein/ATPase family protein associated with various cellular activities (AAA)